jgi:hypothetical protein
VTIGRRRMVVSVSVMLPLLCEKIDPLLLFVVR